MPKPKNIGDLFIETLNKAVSRDEVVDLSKQIMDLVKKSSEMQREKTAQHSDEMTAQLQAHMEEVKAAAEEMMRAVGENKEITRSEARTITRLLQQEVKRLEEVIEETRESMPDLEPLRSEMTTRIAEVEAKIPTLPKEKNIEGMIEDVRSYFDTEMEKLRNEMKTRTFGTVGSRAIGPSVIVKSLYNQSFSETPDDNRTTFTLVKAPRTPGAERIYQNRTRLHPGTSNDYTVAGRVVTFNVAPQTGDVLHYDLEY